MLIHLADAIDDVTGLEDEAEGDEVVDQVLEEIGVDLKNSVGLQKVSCERLSQVLMQIIDGRNSTRITEYCCGRGQNCTSHRRPKQRWWRSGRQ